MDITLINLFGKCNIKNINVLNIDDYKDLKKIKNITTKYVIFYKNSSEFKNVNFSHIIDFMNTNNFSLYALCPKYRSNNKLMNVNFKNREGIILSKDEIFNLNLDSYIIKKDLLNDIMYNEMFEENILLKIFSKVDKYYQSNNEVVIKKIDIIKDNALFTNYSNKEWYLSYVKNLISSISDKHHVKALILSLYLERIYVNSKESTIKILSNDEYSEFIKLSKELLAKIDDDLLSYGNINKNISISWPKIPFLAKLKYNQSFTIKNDDLYCNNILLFERNELSINVVTINYKNGYLLFDCKINRYMKEYNDLEVIYNDSKLDYISTNIYSASYLFGEKRYSDYTFQFKIDINSTGKLIFKLNNKKIKIIFSGIHSKLNEKYKSYWNIKNKCLKYKNDEIEIVSRNTFNTFICEIKYNFSVLRREKKKCIKSLCMRVLYFLTLPYYSKKDIWLTFDKIYKSGDCGEYLYRYIVKRNKYMYYILSPKAKFYKKIKSETKNVLDYGSLKCKLLCFHSKKIFVSDSISAYYCSLSNYMAVINRNLLNYQVNCIQHGLTMQDIEHRQNRLFDNIDNYFIASAYEKKNLLKSEYGYNDEQIKITGIPRFDGLKSKPKNLILLAPTWRVDVASNIAKNRVRVHNDNFKNTNYFKIFNSIINNKELLKLLEKNKYKMIFLIHPTLISNKDDYAKNKYVKIYSAADVNYEDILTETKLMITDYSGVQYDFAYMNKPVIYFHTNDLPPSYGDGMMNYKTMGFGPIVENEKELVNSIKKIFENKFKNEKKYADRVNKFFEYHDYNSCKRIYEVIVGEKDDEKNN